MIGGRIRHRKPRTGARPRTIGVLALAMMLMLPLVGGAAAFVPGRVPRLELLAVQRAGSELFLRYRVERSD